MGNHGSCDLLRRGQTKNRDDNKAGGLGFCFAAGQARNDPTLCRVILSPRQPK